MFLSVDSITDGMALLIDDEGQTLELPVDFLPEGTREGDMLFYGRDGLVPAPDETEVRRAQAAGLLDALLQGDKADEADDAAKADVDGE